MFFGVATSNVQLEQSLDNGFLPEFHCAWSTYLDQAIGMASNIK